MAEPSFASFRNERTQRWLAGGLALVLLVVLYRQFGGSADEPPLELVRPENNSTGTSAPTEGDGRLSAVSAAGSPLPDIPLDEALMHDPFAVPRPVQAEPVTPPTADEPTAAAPAAESEPAPGPQRQQSLQAELQQDVVRLIIRGPQGPAALFRGRWVHEGDVIDGVRVREITPDGLLVELLEPEPPQAAATEPAAPADDAAH